MDPLTIESSVCGQFIVRQGDKESGCVAWDELVALVVVLTKPERTHHTHMMKTAEQREHERQLIRLASSEAIADYSGW